MCIGRSSKTRGRPAGGRQVAAGPSRALRAQLPNGARAIGPILKHGSRVAPHRRVAGSQPILKSTEVGPDGRSPKLLFSASVGAGSGESWKVCMFPVDGFNLSPEICTGGTARKNVIISRPRRSAAVRLLFQASRACFLASRAFCFGPSLLSASGTGSMHMTLAGSTP